ncbi:hypothetical protein [Natranaerofaba carboxydovora]|uniref:hypothetical protein n=1 Tax=Natranaerofaba carboxydovora TaxID=2742683 RepID=UPI001F13CB0C|nr:hypothetical protein [Natranaerofaba carboxydovora]UMZ73077.1 hypothetical protein ACONDI_00623 [Natranaerofaba carboxydovora]
MNRLIIIERRRIIPLVLLIVLMGGLTIYDNIRGDIGGIMPVQDEDAEETGEIIAGQKLSSELKESSIDYVTADRGFRTSPKTFEVAKGLEEWVDIIEHNDLSLPDYPYNEYNEVGVFAFNSKIESLELVPEEEKRANGQTQIQIEVNTKEKENHYHVVVVSKDVLARNGDVQNWRFVNEDGDVIYQLATEISDD